MQSLLAATVPHNSCKTSSCSKPHSEVITGATDSARRPSPLCSPHIAAVANVCQRQPSNLERRVTKGSAMGTHFPEPTLAELLSDPVTRAVMQADGVNPWELEEMLRGLAHLRAQSSDDTNLPPATSPPFPRR